MPIKGLSETVRLPRLGKIHLGIKAKSKTGVEHPQKTDYFVFPKDHSDYEALVKIFGEKPKELRILIPVEDEEQWATQYYKAYDRTHGLVCKGDGESATRMVDTKTGDLTSKDTTTVALKEMTCAGKACPEYKAKKCQEVMNLRFILPEVPGLGVWQIDTGSINSILNINACAKMIRGTFGRITLVPLKLTLEPIEVTNPENGKKQTVYVLNLRSTVTIAQLADAAREQVKVLAIEAPDLETAYDVQLEEDTNSLWGEPETKAIGKPTSATKTPPITSEKQQPEASKSPESNETQGEAVEAPLETTKAESEKPKFDLPWLQDSLAKLATRAPKSWGEAILITRMQKDYKVKGTDSIEIAQQLDQGKLAHFIHAVQEALDLI